MYQILNVFQFNVAILEYEPMFMHFLLINNMYNLCFKFN